MKASIYPSENDLQTVIDYYNGALYSRLDNKKTGRIIVIMQRIHENDLVGYLLQQEGWHRVNLPAIAAEDDEIDISSEEYYPR